MNSTSLHIKIDPAIKKQAQQTADALGLSLSAVIKSFLKQFIRTKQFSVGLPEVPNEYLKKTLQESDEDIQAGRVISFDSGEEAVTYLSDEIEHEKRAGN